MFPKPQVSRLPDQGLDPDRGIVLRTVFALQTKPNVPPLLLQALCWGAGGWSAGTSRVSSGVHGTG